MKSKKKLAGIALLVGLAYLRFGAEPGWGKYGLVAPPFVQCDVSIGFPGSFGIGLLGIVALPDGTVRAANCCEGGFFSSVLPATSFCATGAPTNLQQIQHEGLALGLDGRLYATRGFSDVVELDPSNGNILRTLASGIGALGIAVDPLTGDLFVAGGIPAGGTLVNRIANPGGCGTSCTSSIFSRASTRLDGVGWSCDGSFLLAAGEVADELIRIDRDGNSSVFVQLPPGTGPDGIAFGTPATPLEGFAFSNNNDGTVTEIPLSNPSMFQTIASGGNRGDHASVDMNGNLLLSQVDRITRLSTTNGGRWDVPGANLCSNLRCATIAATSRDVCVTDPSVKHTINEKVKRICANVNCDAKTTQRLLCDLISLLSEKAQDCTALLMAARTLRDALSAVFPSPCPGT